MRTSESIKSLAEALSKAQGEFPIIEKTKEVSKKGVSKKTGKEYEIKYKFAPYETIVEAIKAIISKHNLSYAHDIDVIKKICTTRLMHLSGEWLESDFPIVMGSSDMQDHGKDSTYAKRYGLSNLLGLATDEDIDGTDEPAEIKTVQKKQDYEKPKAPEKPKNFAPMSLMDQIADLAKQKGMSNASIKDAIKKATGKNNSQECSDDELSAVVAFLRMKM